MGERVSVGDASFLFWVVVFGGSAFMSGSGFLGAARGRDRQAAGLWGALFVACSVLAAYFFWRLL